MPASGSWPSPPPDVDPAVERGVILSRNVPVCTDLLTVGGGTVIRKDSFLSCYRARAGMTIAVRESNLKFYWRPVENYRLRMQYKLPNWQKFRVLIKDDDRTS